MYYGWLALSHLWALPLRGLHLHHFGSSGGSANPPTPEIKVFIWTALAIIVVTPTLSLGGGLVLFAWTRRIRHLLWTIPLVNLLLYGLGLYLRPYPGGFKAQFQGEGLVNTILEIVLLVILATGMALLLALVLALLRAIVRWIGRLRRGPDQPAASPPAPADTPPAVPATLARPD